MRVLILANGDPPSSTLALRETERADLIVAADGAANYAYRLGITPHIICGDFDSILQDKAALDFPEARFVATPDQELADLEKAIEVAYDEGATSVTILGAGGGRVDHLLSNYAVLLVRPEREISIIDERSSVVAAAEQGDEPAIVVLKTVSGDTVSLLCFGEPARVSIDQVRWPLNDFLLEVGSHGVSNKALGDRVTVTVRTGAVLICHLPAEHNP